MKYNYVQIKSYLCAEVSQYFHYLLINKSHLGCFLNIRIPIRKFSDNE